MLRPSHEPSSVTFLTAVGYESNNSSGRAGL
jgi:hypothetical protein